MGPSVGTIGKVAEKCDCSRRIRNLLLFEGSLHLDRISPTESFHENENIN